MGKAPSGDVWASRLIIDVADNPAKKPRVVLLAV